MEKLEKLATELVKTHIKGNRKGMQKPIYEHSINVYKILKQHGLSRTVYVAGLLHDIIEDSNMTTVKLLHFGFSKRIVELVKLCSHDKKINNGDGRWVKMIAGLVDANDRDAYAIKLADILDNLRDSHTMRPERGEFLYFVKRPLLLSITRDKFKNTKLWKEVLSFKY